MPGPSPMGDGTSKTEATWWDCRWFVALRGSRWVDERSGPAEGEESACRWAACERLATHGALQAGSGRIPRWRHEKVEPCGQGQLDRRGLRGPQAASQILDPLPQLIVEAKVSVMAGLSHPWSGHVRGLYLTDHVRSIPHPPNVVHWSSRDIDMEVAR